MYLNLHAIHSLGPSNANRDDLGMPKSVVYGGIRRARISSQAWKKAIRDDWKQTADHTDLAIRTACLPRLIAATALHTDPDQIALDDPMIGLADRLITDGLKLKTSKKKDDAEPKLASMYLIGTRTIQWLGDWLDRHKDDPDFKKTVIAEGKTLREKVRETGMNTLDVALFGRMAADNATLTTDGVVQYGHAIGITPYDVESDWYAAVDDMNGQSGAGMLGDIPYVTPTFYRYANINLTQLADRAGALTPDMIRLFVNSFAMTVPHGKETSFAQATLPSLLYATITDRPMNLQNAYSSPVDGDPIEQGIRRLVNTVERSENMWGIIPDHTWLTAPLDGQYGHLGDPIPFPKMLDGIQTTVKDMLR
ncbi:type I-E CRISPR-associated protein Cas7/Cse4/CasC [Bifidobacterium sp. SO1]|uniref:type I-E CRISPR-associated protein Cas7/Cse4/CasC n=1 Tax=Bifidobacterium sp. SO1 TaxID=2809029 RepID=UPI001BDCB859|nr:type I-E CRISPR-associated protein Cas7/Cse4/CasC [Bifidobacterium sp. SO1]MBT1161720.1 type I-E CRISPR-associated protein Cas7/Cse4/CasC [Bifidobacterium sp. SO1]